MQQIGVRELRQHASRWLRSVAEGERYEVTVRGEPVALLVPIPADEDPLERLVARGVITRGSIGLAASLEKHPLLPPAPPGTMTASERLAELRRDER